jgi:hypothetical protein
MDPPFLSGSPGVFYEVCGRAGGVVALSSAGCRWPGSRRGTLEQTLPDRYHSGEAFGVAWGTIENGTAVRALPDLCERAVGFDVTATVTVGGETTMPERS